MNKRTPFYSLHKKHSAKLVSFSGYEMPIQYKGIGFEHNHVRNSVGIFDVSHMAQILINGANAFALSPGKIIGYDCNRFTLKELEQNGYKVITSNEYIENYISYNKTNT